eukprot:408167-Prymnesium_polylepis.3
MVAPKSKHSQHGRKTCQKRKRLAMNEKQRNQPKTRRRQDAQCRMRPCGALGLQDSAEAAGRG